MAAVAPEPPVEGKREHGHVAIDATGRKQRQPRKCDRHHEDVDEDQIKRKLPGGLPYIADVPVFRHRDMKLAWQHHHREGRDERHRQQREGIGTRAEHRLEIDRLGGLCEQILRPREQAEGHIGADCEEGDELDDRFQRDRQHEAIMVFGRVDAPGAEGDGKEREHQSDHERQVVEERKVEALHPAELADDIKRGGDRF